ncbi:MAG: hypothetical protein KAH84_02875 [Thiomargarita sp.]|nr:hypothetical protein [Bacteroidales bacterium]MCK5718876.1 hypothetical protein [Thiomargarita sp.]
MDGDIEINSPDMDMEGFLVVLPGGFIDANNIMKTPCGQQSSFVIRSSEGSRSSPDDFLPSETINIG